MAAEGWAAARKMPAGRRTWHTGSTAQSTGRRRAGSNQRRRGRCQRRDGLEAGEASRRCAAFREHCSATLAWARRSRHARRRFQPAAADRQAQGKGRRPRHSSCAAICARGATLCSQRGRPRNRCGSLTLLADSHARCRRQARAQPLAIASRLRHGGWRHGAARGARCGLHHRPPAVPVFGPAGYPSRMIVS